MTIEQGTDESHYNITIHWSCSAAEDYEWNLSGSYDAPANIITYSGNKIHILYSEDGNIYKEFSYTDGKGIFYLDSDHNLYWEDYKEDQGDKCIFQKDADFVSDVTESARI